jgi:hypothetical protein
MGEIECLETSTIKENVIINMCQTLPRNRNFYKINAIPESTLIEKAKTRPVI